MEPTPSKFVRVFIDRPRARLRSMRRARPPAVVLAIAAFTALAYVAGAPGWILAVGVLGAGAAARASRRRPAAPLPAQRTELAAPRDAGDGSAARRAVGYVQVTADGESALGEHTDTIGIWCADAGLALTTVVHDIETASGGALARPALQWAREQIASGNADTLVVARLAHLSPTVADLPRLFDWFESGNRSLVAIDLGIDTATEAGRTAAHALARVGHWEHERLSVRTRRGLEAARASGRKLGRPSVSDVPELRDYITSMRAQGMTLQAIADTLNEQGVPTLRGGTEWRPSSVQRAAGYRRPRATDRWLGDAAGSPPLDHAEGADGPVGR